MEFVSIRIGGSQVDVDDVEETLTVTVNVMNGQEDTSFTKSQVDMVVTVWVIVRLLVVVLKLVNVVVRVLV